MHVLTTYKNAVATNEINTDVGLRYLTLRLIFYVMHNFFLRHDVFRDNEYVIRTFSQ
jgi:hypothetical protein